jgi:hypothetical protein
MIAWLVGWSMLPIHVAAFTPFLSPQQFQSVRFPQLHSAPIQDVETTSTTTSPAKKPDETNDPTTVSASSSSSPSSAADGLPWWWEFVWNNFDVLQPGRVGTDITFGDTATVLRTNIEQLYGGFPSVDGCPVAQGALNDLAEGTMFVGLQKYYQTYGSPYKLCFGPKSFLVISDPMQAKHILRDANPKYDKGVLAEILEVRVHCLACSTGSSWCLTTTGCQPMDLYLLLYNNSQLWARG